MPIDTLDTNTQAELAMAFRATAVARMRLRRVIAQARDRGAQDEAEALEQALGCLGGGLDWMILVDQDLREPSHQFVPPAPAITRLAPGNGKIKQFRAHDSADALGL